MPDKPTGAGKGAASGKRAGTRATAKSGTTTAKRATRTAAKTVAGAEPPAAPAGAAESAADTSAAKTAGPVKTAGSQPAQASAAAEPATAPRPAPNGRLTVRKTYKLFIGGAFPRSESGRTYLVRAPGGEANAAQASRKDTRDAVVAARAAVGKWSGATAYNRGQVLYRVAEMLEGRADQFTAEVAAAEQVPDDQARRQVEAAVDRWVWYAGWPDKVAQIAGSANPVAGPYFNFSVPEPTGVAGVVAPPDSSLLGLVSVLAPVIATGNTAILVSSEDQPLPAITLAEVLATSDVPGGVVNILTGRTAELAPVLASHMDVNAIDVTGVARPARADLERLAAASIKRVFAADDDWTEPPSPRRMLAFLETKTVWHPLGT